MLRHVCLYAFPPFAGRYVRTVDMPTQSVIRQYCKAVVLDTSLSTGAKMREVTRATMSKMTDVTTPITELINEETSHT